VYKKLTKEAIQGYLATLPLLAPKVENRRDTFYISLKLISKFALHKRYLYLFYLFIFKALAAVCNRIRSIQRKFLWEWGRQNKSISWVSWDNVCKPLQERGLGVNELRSFNLALLVKWKWRLMNGEGGKWKEVIVFKYGIASDISQVKLKYQSWWWRDLAKTCGDGNEEGWFQKAFEWKVGNGITVWFWEDVWLQTTTLKALYPRLYSLSCDKGKTVGEVGRWEEDRWRWGLNWRRDRFQWVSNLESELLSILSMATMCKEAPDHLIWRGDPKGMFTVMTIMTNHVDTRGGVFNSLWQAKAKPKVLTTPWRILLDKVPTRANLIRRGVIVNLIMCPLCNLSEETSQHLFLDCVFAQRVWSRCYRWIGVLGAQNKGIQNHLMNSYLIHLSNKQN